MQSELTIEEALQRRDLVFIDVRSASEFSEASIPGAVNLPLLDDDQRRRLGEIYHSAGEAEARRAALKLVSPHLPALIDHIEAAAGDGIPLLYCWRGGLRSLSVFQIMNLAGMRAFRLKGGYRAFRRYVNRRLDNYSLQSKMLVLHGLTGVGKTAVIQELIRRGFPALDLEGLARHRGSSFGAVGIGTQRSQKDFEALLLEQLDRFNGANCIVVEGEGSRIGNVHIPPFLVQAMEDGRRVLLTAPLPERVRRIVEEYLPAQPSAGDLEQIRQSICSLRRRLGKERAAKLLHYLDQGAYAAAAEVLCLEYYDRLYGEARADRDSFCSVIDTADMDQAVDRIIAALQETDIPAAGRMLEIGR